MNKLQYSRTCQTCKREEPVVVDTTGWTTERWNDFQRNIYAPWTCVACTAQWSWD